MQLKISFFKWVKPFLPCHQKSVCGHHYPKNKKKYTPASSVVEPKPDPVVGCRFTFTFVEQDFFWKPWSDDFTVLKKKKKIITYINQLTRNFFIFQLNIISSTYVLVSVTFQLVQIVIIHILIWRFSACRITVCTVLHKPSPALPIELPGVRTGLPGWI